MLPPDFRVLPDIQIPVEEDVDPRVECDLGRALDLDAPAIGAGIERDRARYVTWRDGTVQGALAGSARLRSGSTTGGQSLRISVRTVEPLFWMPPREQTRSDVSLEPSASRMPSREREFEWIEHWAPVRRAFFCKASAVLLSPISSRQSLELCESRAVARMSATHGSGATPERHRPSGTSA